MRRALVPAVVVLAVWLTASFALARGGTFDSDYQGHAEATPTTFVGFDIAKDKHGKRVTRVQALLDYACQGGGSLNVLANAKGSLKVNDAGKFAGTLKINQFAPSRGTLDGGTYKVTGKLQKHGKAKGTIDANVMATSVRCYSGKLDWKAKRGANVVVPRG